MKKVISLTFLTLSLLMPILSKAAGPVMHVVLAQKYFGTLSQAPEPKAQELFLIGTLFPDIRYLGVIKRDQTHFDVKNLAAIQEESGSFRQGMLFHNWVDKFRQTHIRQCQIKRKLDAIPRGLQDVFLKFVEDEILKAQYDVGVMRMIMTTIPDEAKAYNIEQSSLTQWHTLLALYFSFQPSTLLSQADFIDWKIMNLDPETVKLWCTLIPEYAKDPVFQKYVEEMVTEFERSLLKPKAG